MGPYYPVMLNIAGRRCVVFGGGPVALRKVYGLLEAKASVVVVSPVVVDELRQLADEGKLVVLLREYEPQDLHGAALVFAATSSRQINAEVARAAEELGIASNVADAAAEGSFILPSVIRRGDLVLTVSTCGASPAYAAQVKAELLKRYGEEEEAYVSWLGKLREAVSTRIAERWLRHEVLRAAASCPAPEGGVDLKEQHINTYIDRLIQIVRERGHNDGQQNDNSGNKTECACADTDRTGD